MRRNIFILVALLAISENLVAQRVKKDDVKQKPAVQSRPVSVLTYLGAFLSSGGYISKTDFDHHLKQGIVARDSAGNHYAVDGFTFSYAERNLYEDSIGNLIVLTDYLTEFCPGDSVTHAIANNIFHKTKPGDTAYIDNIKVKLPDGTQMAAKGMKFILTK